MKLRLALVTCAALAWTTTAAADHAKRLDSVIAVVDGHPILQSYVRARAVPYLQRIRETLPKEQQAEAENKAIHELEEKMVEEALIAADCDRLRLTVDNDDIDRAIATIAKTANATTAEIITAAKRAGYTEAEYRKDLRRQILEAKWFIKRTTVGMGAPDDKREAARHAALERLRHEFYVELNP